MKSFNARTVETFLTGFITAWTLAGLPLPAAELTGHDINDCRPMAAGRTVAVAPGRDYDLTGGGANFGALQKHDQGHFAYAELEGDFQLTVRLLEFENVANYKNFTQGGLMVRKSLDPGSEFVALVAFATGESNGLGTGFYTRYEYEGIARERGVGGGWRVIGEGSPFKYPVWLRLTRRGDVFIGEQSSDGRTWAKVVGYGGFKEGNSPEVKLPAKLYAGLCVTAHHQAPDRKVTISFRDFTGHPALQPGSVATGSAINPNLVLLPENPRYLQYRGLPCMLFWGTHHWGWREHPTADQLRVTAGYANLITLQATGHRYSSFASLWERVNDDAHWHAVRAAVRAAHELGLLVHLYFFDGNYSLEAEKYDRPTRFFHHYSLDEDLAAHGLPGVTRRRIHLRVMEQAVEHLGEFPNIVFDPVFEMVNTYRWEFGAEEFTRWWADTFRQEGKARHPGVSHLLGTMYGGNEGVVNGRLTHLRGAGQRVSHPHRRMLDLLIGEHRQDGFFTEPEENPTEVYDWRVPMLRMALHSPHWQEGRTNDLGGPAHQLMVRQLIVGMHTAEGYNQRDGRWTVDLTAPALRNWMRRARWYLENIRTWEDEPGRFGGDEITADKLPGPDTSQPPVLEPVAGFPAGAQVRDGRIEFAARFRDPERERPALAEVWVDANGDGRFDPNPAKGERISMTRKDDAPGTSPVFRTSLPLPERDAVSYTFRFADSHWNPPVGGEGLMPLDPYDHQVLELNNAKP